MFLFIFDKYNQLDMLKKLPLIFNNNLVPIKVQYLVCIVSVSYTHLDVYKRQSLMLFSVTANN